MAEGRRAVMVVDDDVELVKMVELVLEGAGYDVVTALEGQEALEKVAKDMPQVILLDMKMPGVDGWEFAREFHDIDDLIRIVEKHILR